MPLAAACRGARAAAAAAPLPRSRRGAEEGSAPARRLREAEVRGGGGAGPLRPALADGAFPEQPGRVTLRGLRLAGNSSVAARACRAGRERAGAAGGAQAAGAGKCARGRGQSGAALPGSPSRHRAPRAGAARRGRRCLSCPGRRRVGKGPKAPRGRGARLVCASRPGRRGMSRAAAWPLLWGGFPGSPGRSPRSVFCAVAPVLPAWDVRTAGACVELNPLSLSLNFLVSLAIAHLPAPGNNDLVVLSKEK